MQLLPTPTGRTRKAESSACTRVPALQIRSHTFHRSIHAPPHTSLQKGLHRMARKKGKSHSWYCTCGNCPQSRGGANESLHSGTPGGYEPPTEEPAQRPCPVCDYPGKPASAMGLVYDPTNPNASVEGLVTCSNCDGEGIV